MKGAARLVECVAGVTQVGAGSAERARLLLLALVLSEHGGGGHEAVSTVTQRVRNAEQRRLFKLCAQLTHRSRRAHGACSM
eukprot:6212165-Pleurochrysis_carterae.AAC.5